MNEILRSEKEKSVSLDDYEIWIRIPIIVFLASLFIKKHYDTGIQNEHAKKESCQIILNSF